jgi:hypothetical protein
MTQPITVNSRWPGRQTFVEVVVTRVTLREVSYIAADGTISGSVPQWQFLQDFEPVTGKQKPRKPA